MPENDDPITPESDEEIIRRVRRMCPHRGVSEEAERIAMNLLAHRAYPRLSPSGACSIHRDPTLAQVYCTICYPDLNALLDAHMEVFNRLYDDLLALAGMADPPNGRVGTNAILERLREMTCRGRARARTSARTREGNSSRASPTTSARADCSTPNSWRPTR